MAEPRLESERTSLNHLIDPRAGDVEDDVSSPKTRSILAIAGTLLAEISLPKLAFSFIVSIVLPSILLGLAPLVASAWVVSVTSQILVLTEVGAVVALVVIATAGWLGWRPLLRMAEESFWSLNALLVQPAYMLGTEALRHLSESLLRRAGKTTSATTLRAASSAIAGIAMFGLGLFIAILAWPASRWTGTASDLLLPQHLIVPTIANAFLLVSIYFAVMSVLSGFYDAGTEQPRGLQDFDEAPTSDASWRVAHLTDLHVVGERYGFRIESGRAGPRGNDRLRQLLKQLADIHRSEPLDIILVTGDVTDAGRSTEWANFFDLIEQHPALRDRMVILPGNHDLNIGNRSNPAQIDLPFSHRKILRQARTLSAMSALQGSRAYLADAGGHLHQTLDELLEPHKTDLENLAEAGGMRTTRRLRPLFQTAFPLIIPPRDPNGLGVIMLNSNAESHFSFTNALGFVSVEQAQRLFAVLARFPNACWIIALHHHLQEYPKAVPFSIRIGTVLINGSWFIRKLAPHASRVIVMHGHRHLDWIGLFGSLKVISGPSPVMAPAEDKTTHFYIHRLATGDDRQIRLLQPQQVVVVNCDADSGSRMP